MGPNTERFQPSSAAAMDNIAPSRPGHPATPKSKTSQRGRIWPFLVGFPAEIIDMILSRLPIKDLTNMRIVLPVWSEMIDKYRFQHIRLPNNKAHSKDSFNFLTPARREYIRYVIDD